MLYANVAAEKLLGFSREDKDAGLWDEGDESGGNGDSATQGCDSRFGIHVLLRNVFSSPPLHAENSVEIMWNGEHPGQNG